MCIFIISLLNHADSSASFVKCLALFTYGSQNGFLPCVFLQLSVRLTLMSILLSKVLHWLASSSPSFLAINTKGSGTWPLVNSTLNLHQALSQSFHSSNAKACVVLSLQQAIPHLACCPYCCFCLKDHTAQQPILPPPDSPWLLLEYFLREVQSTDDFGFIWMCTIDAKSSMV